MGICDNPNDPFCRCLACLRAIGMLETQESRETRAAWRAEARMFSKVETLRRMREREHKLAAFCAQG